MSDRTIKGKNGLMGSIETRNPTLTYSEAAVRIDGKGYSGTIPVSAISAVFIGIKRLFPKPLLIAAIAAGVIGIILFIAGVDNNDGVAGAGGFLLLIDMFLFAIYYSLKGAVFGITSGGYRYTLSVKTTGSLPDGWEAKKDELSELVIAGRRQRQPMASTSVADAS